ncbi:MAG: hypothetical protein AB7F96_16460 [Beijerinckiaceae bacterium]
MKLTLPRAMAFANGSATALIFTRLTIGDALKLAETGDILDAAVAAEYAAQYGKGIDADGAEFALTADDILNSTSTAPAAAVALAFAAERDWEGDKLDPDDQDAKGRYATAQEGERLPTKPLDAGETAFYKLLDPVDIAFKVGGEDETFNLEWLEFAPQKFKDIERFVRATFEGAPERTLYFITGFARIPATPEHYPLPDGRLMDAFARKISLRDGERIAALVMPHFFEIASVS